MANNCLVTKLKESVQNDNLPILGYITIECLNGYDIPQYLRINVEEECHIISKSGENTVKGVTGSEYTNSVYISPNELFGVNLKPDKFILPKYHIRKITNITFYSELTLMGSGLSINIDDLKYSPISDFRIHGDNVKGHLSSFAGKTLDHLQFMNWGEQPFNSELIGTTEDIANITFGNDARLVLPKSITGSINLISGSFSWVTFGPGCSGDLVAFLENSPNMMYVQCRHSTIQGDISHVTCPLSLVDIANTGVRIEAAQFAATQAGVGRTTGSLGNNGWWGSSATLNGEVIGIGNDSIKWKPSTTSGAVTDVMSSVLNKAIAVDASGNYVADVPVW